MCAVDKTIMINNKNSRYEHKNYRFCRHKYDNDEPVIEPDIWGQRPAACCGQVTL